MWRNQMQNSTQRNSRSGCWSCPTASSAPPQKKKKRTNCEQKKHVTLLQYSPSCFTFWMTVSWWKMCVDLTQLLTEYYRGDKLWKVLVGETYSRYHWHSFYTSIICVCVCVFPRLKRTEMTWSVWNWIIRGFYLTCFLPMWPSTFSCPTHATWFEHTLCKNNFTLYPTPAVQLTHCIYIFTDHCIYILPCWDRPTFVFSIST